MAVGLCLAMETHKSDTRLRLATISFLTLVAAGVALQGHSLQAAGPSATQPLVRGISFHEGPGGAIIIDVSVTAPVPYQTTQLSHPDRLVVDLQGARESGLKAEYPAQSPLLKRVRTGQWKSDPAVVRVVADLQGHPSFSITKQASGIRIELEPRGAGIASNPDAQAAAAHAALEALSQEDRTAQEDPPPDKAFQVHRFKDLSASLTAPVLPSHDKLIPVANPDLMKPRRKEATTIAQVSGISIQPGSQGETTVDIASSKSVPYRVFQLADPFRLVIDLKDARSSSSPKVYPVNSPVLKTVRVEQWRPGKPSVVRVVANLEGYPIFDVHAQQPGIRIELRPRYIPRPPMRNPFRFKTAPQGPQAVQRGTPSNRAVAAGGNPPVGAPGAAFAEMKVIGFIDKAGAGTQAVISHNAGVYLVSKGGTFENTFTVVAISADAVEVENTVTQQTRWIPYAP